MRITNDIREALKKAVAGAGGQIYFGKKVGIAQTTLSRYLSGKIPVIRLSNWAKLAPHLAPYLPDGGEYQKLAPHGTSFRPGAGMVIPSTPYAPGKNPFWDMINGNRGEFVQPEQVLDLPDYSARIADALESIAQSLELIANPASVLDTKTGKITPASRNPSSICEM